MTAKTYTEHVEANESPLVSMREITKSFSGVKVLDGVNFEVVEGRFMPLREAMVLASRR